MQVTQGILLQIYPNNRAVSETQTTHTPVQLDLKQDCIRAEGFGRLPNSTAPHQKTRKNIRKYNSSKNICNENGFSHESCRLSAADLRADCPL